jgi:hypothetical protein
MHTHVCAYTHMQKAHTNIYMHIDTFKDIARSPKTPARHKVIAALEGRDVILRVGC